MSAVNKNKSRGRDFHPEKIFLVYVLFLGTRSGLEKIWEKINHLRNPNLNSTKEIETIRVKSKSENGHLEKKVFTKVNSNPVDLSWFGAVEYWFPLFIRSLEAYYLLKYGRKLFEQVGETAWKRSCKMMFASFAVFPLLDSLIPQDWNNPTERQQETHNRYDLKFRLPLYLWTFVELATTYKFLEICGNPKSKFTIKDNIGLLIILSIFNGAVGINSSHELLHKPKPLEKVLAYTLLANVNYMHWGEEHLTGHHEKVATREDPATSRLNESFYQFIPRTLFGSYKSAWDLEQKRLQKINASSIFQNRMLWNAIIPLLLGSTYSFIAAKRTKGGNSVFFKILAMFYIQGIGSAMFLEAVNYVEHYGLERDKLPDGSYESVNPTHSWNSSHHFSNALLYKLQRHSDHHTHAMRPYELLRNFNESPQLPTGYPGMIILALFPPVYQWIMNPLVKATKVSADQLNGEGSFEKSQEWIEAEKVAKRKMLAFSVTFFMGSAVALRHVLKAD